MIHPVCHTTFYYFPIPPPQAEHCTVPLVAGAPSQYFPNLIRIIFIVPGCKLENQNRACQYA